MKDDKKMKLGKMKMDKEPRKEKVGPKMKMERTSESNKRQKESSGRVVKSKMKTC